MEVTLPQHEEHCCSHFFFLDSPRDLVQLSGRAQVSTLVCFIPELYFLTFVVFCSGNTLYSLSFAAQKIARNLV